jgi:hypothetical protein
MHVAVVRHNPRFVFDTAECAAGVVDHAGVDFIDGNTPVRFSPENCVHIGERALALNLDPRRHRAVISCLSSNLRVSFVTFVLALNIAVVRYGPVRRPRRRQATPLRSVPCGLAGLTAPRLRRRSGNYVMATGRSRTCSALEIE